MLVTDQPEGTPVSSDALAGKNPLDSKPIQGALIAAAMVKFVGNSGELLDNPPDLDHQRTYVVKATCQKTENVRREDGEVRTTVVMKIDSCYERGRVPIVDESQPSLYSVPAADDEAAEGGGDNA